MDRVTAAPLHSFSLHSSLSLSVCLSVGLRVLLLFIPSLRLGPSEPHKETFVPTLVEWSLVSEVVKEIQGDRTSKQSQHKSPGPEAPLCLSRPGNECPLVLITLRAHTEDMTDSIVLCVFYVARGHSLPVNIWFVLPPRLPPGDQRAVCTGLSGQSEISLCLSRRHITFKIYLFVALFNHDKTIKKTPGLALQFFLLLFFFGATSHHFAAILSSQLFCAFWIWLSPSHQSAGKDLCAHWHALTYARWLKWRDEERTHLQECAAHLQR